jgi:hypothetical protein
MVALTILYPWGSQNISLSEKEMIKSKTKLIMTMKFYLIIATVCVLLTSCLKHSIADAMLDEKEGKKITATFSYQVNGTPISLSIPDADNPVANGNLTCKKSLVYILGAVVDYGVFDFTFYTDSLKVGNYKYTRADLGETYMMRHGYNQYIYGPNDYMSFNITSYSNGHISGTFDGRLTPCLIESNVNNTYGAPGSTLITNGSFNNVPVIY